MPADPIDCPDCHEAFQYWQTHCRCGCFVGYPNQRAAAAERDELEKRYSLARDDCQRRGTAGLLSKLEALAEQSRPVIAMSFGACDDILRPGKYRNYHQRVDSGEREPAGALDHSDRAMVGERLFPMYSEHIEYAVLSPDGRGLLNYGPVAVRWEVTATYLGRRVSLLEENSFSFFDHHELGRRGTAVPSGYQSTWEDRSKLVAAKLAPYLTVSTGEGSLAELMVQPGTTRKEDDFIEVFIYAEKGLDTQDVNLVTRQGAATTSDDRQRWEIIREVCSTRKIDLVE